jgi:Phosphoglucose isomerase N-terminal domain/Bacterial phospho-glucose isomerase C-terminal SIS domain
VLDSTERYNLDTANLAQTLEGLPRSYSGSLKKLPAPYGVIGFGEGAWAAEVARAWIDASIVAGGGTQFVLLGGLDFGEADAGMLIAEAVGANLYRMGVGTKEARAIRDEKGLTLKFVNPLENLEHLIPISPFSSYSYLQALSYACGRASSAEAAEVVLEDLRDRCKTLIPSDNNPAKELAWKLWTRTPILLAGTKFQSQIWAWQVLLSRLGKSMSIPIERNPLTVIACGFEARHETGDSLVALFLGGSDEALEFMQEVLESRVDEVIQVPALGVELYAQQLGLWYFGAWVSYYLALLYSIDPKDSTALNELRNNQ